MDKNGDDIIGPWRTFGQNGGGKLVSTELHTGKLDFFSIKQLDYELEISIAC